MTTAPIAGPRRAGWAKLALAALALATVSMPAQAQSGMPGKPGQLIETKPAKPVPELSFTDIDEKPASLAAFKGQKLIVNLWATWCGPCITEMPSLMKLAGTLQGKGVTVIAVSEDRGGKFVVDPFLKEHHIEGLPIFLDKTMSTGKALKATTILPMTLLLDADGNEIGRVFGDRDWDSSRLVMAGLDRPSTGAICR
jgi:thiol-disulfide isomerase/thioredoxin